MPQNINLNIPPYNDDFDAKKNYHRVLFKPDYSIQTRELTTLQSILQNQIEKFGQHFFKEGSVVIPGNIGVDLEYTCVEINPVHLGIPVSTYLNNLIGSLIKGQTSNVVAKIENVITDSTSERNNFTLYIKYQSSSESNFTTDKFIDGENLILLSDVSYELGVLRQNNTFATTISNNSTSIGSAVFINEGVFFIRGHFVNVNAQTLLLEQYSNTPSYRVGLLIDEFFASASNEYSDLYDNAQGFSNFTAPGADRLVIKCTLIQKSLNDFSDQNFIQLLTIENGVIKKIVKNTEYSYILDELAKRTYDESGDYYVSPFNLQIRESLNNYLGNNGIYDENQITINGNIPSDDIACISISPGKAYVRGYGVETTENTILDVQKARTTESALNESVQFNFGDTFELDNVYGTVSVGFGTQSYVKLQNARTATVGISSGTEIGLARVYDLRLKDAEYNNSSSKYQISLFDIQTYTDIILSSSTPTISTSSYIEGKNSGAVGYVISTSNGTIRLHQVSGSFVRNEQININGILDNRIITSIVDYSIDDIKQLVSYNSGITTFTADTVLSKRTAISDNNSFTISQSSSGISTITTTGYFNTSVKANDIISYTKPGASLPTYNLVKTISNDYKKLEIIGVSSSVLGVNEKELPTSQINLVSDLAKVSPTISNSNSGGLYSPLNHNSVSYIDVSKSNITVRKSFTVNITNVNFETSVLENNFDYRLEPFDVERYNLSYVDGTIASLNSQNTIPNPTTGRIIFKNLPKTGSAVITATYKKVNCKTRKKEYQRCFELIVNKTNSGINTAGTGLSYSSTYGLRVEDASISLNTPDVTEVIGIFESYDDSNPDLPTITVNNLSKGILNSIKGELIIGKVSKTAAILVTHNNSNIVDIIYRNDNRFQIGEDIIFDESKIEATIQSFTIGDRDISSHYIFDSGTRSSYLDYSRIIRNPQYSSPKRRIRIVFNRYVIDTSDDGTFVAVNSYDAERYSRDILPVDNIRGNDIVDFRPRVSDYTLSQYSPFDFRSRNFDNSSNSSPDIVFTDDSFILSYNYHLPRTDKLYLSKDGVFTLVSGVPSLSPKEPTGIEQSMEIATIAYPPYVYNVKDISILSNNYKRYTMKDISGLETRLSNVEYYTSLSLLEADTKSLTIKDPQTNLDRFKSGFFVDNFSSYEGGSGDINNPLFRCNIDITTNKLKPLIREKLISLEFDSTNSTNVSLTGDLNLNSISNKKICLSYTHAMVLENVYATRTENVNPFNVITVNGNWVGDVELSPTSDIWSYNESETRNTKGALGVSGNMATFSTSWLPSWSHDEKYQTNYTTTFNLNEVGKLSANKKYITGKVSASNTFSRTIPVMRSINISILASKLKPSTMFYAFFDGIDVTRFIVPKLLEVQMSSGTFAAGETVSGTLGNKTISFRLASQNHKRGQILSPTEIYTRSPYDLASPIPSNYSSTTTILNVDIESLRSHIQPEYYGCISVGMMLIGKTSGATATIKNIRVVTDSTGEFTGSLHIPDSSNVNNPKFETGEKTFTLTTSQSNASLPGSSAKTTFTANGTINSKTTVVTEYTVPVEKLKSPVKRYVDPLAQSFLIKNNAPGIFVTKCDIYFQSKDENNNPVTLELRTMENGVPTGNILSDVVLYPDKINISDDASVPTTFIFNSPVYLEDNIEYALVLLTNSNLYNVWISRAGDPVISGNLSQGSQNIMVSQLTEVGVLFKSQNGSTWDPSQLEDLKFTLYRAEFDQNVGMARFVNSELGIGNGGVSPLSLNDGNYVNPITTYSKSLKLTLNSNLITPAQNGQTVTQTGNLNFTSKLTGTVGAIGIGSTLNIISGGSGFIGGGTTVYSNVDLISETGYGAGGKVNLSIVNGVAIAATVTNGGNGYSMGDILSIDYSDTNNLGKDLIISVPNTTGIITSVNSMLLERVQGDLALGSGDLIINGVTATGIYPLTEETILNQDGLHFKVYHPNHGMYSDNNLVKISGVESDSSPSKLTATLTTLSSTISIDSVQNFIQFEGKNVGVGTTGYVLIDNEIIGYESVNIGDNTLGNITSNRGVDSTTATSHLPGTLVYKYEFNGVSLRKINKTHIMSNVDESIYPSPIDLDSYYVNIDTVDGIYFKENKSGGVYNSDSIGIYKGPKATQNITYSMMRPIVNLTSPPFTEVTSKARTFSATSASGNEEAFNDFGYSNITLNVDNIFDSLRAVYSRVNETQYLTTPDKKSLFIDVYLKTNNSRVSPFVDVSSISASLSSYRINDPIGDFTTDDRVNKLYDDPCSMIYVSEIIRLETPADSLKVLFDAYRHETNDIRVAYRVLRNDTPDEEQLYELFPGYGNISSRGETIDTSKSNGLPDRLVTPSGNRNEFKNYEYSVILPYGFTGYQIKIMVTGTNQAITPEFKDLRAIATI